MLLVLQGGCQGAEQAAGTFYSRGSQEGVQFQVQVGAQPSNPPMKFGSHQVSCLPESMHHVGQFVYVHKPLVTQLSAQAACMEVQQLQCRLHVQHQQQCVCTRVRRSPGEGGLLPKAHAAIHKTSAQASKCQGQPLD